MTVKFAILGAGRIGQVHAKAVTATPGATLVAIADPMIEAAQSVAQKYGCDIRTIDDIAASSDVDAVLICTPTNTHADLIEQFAKVGKAMFCEKPVDLSLKRVQDCLATVAAEGATLMVGFNRRFDPDFMAVKAAIDSGRVGDVEMITITSRDPGAPPVEYIKVSGGIFRDMTIHDFDMARWLLGEEVETVMAQASVLTDPKIGEAGILIASMSCCAPHPANRRSSPIPAARPMAMTSGSKCLAPKAWSRPGTWLRPISNWPMVPVLARRRCSTFS